MEQNQIRQHNVLEQGSYSGSLSKYNVHNTKQ